MAQNPQTFIISSASAGSGKTFTLVQTYLRLVLGNENKESFSPQKFTKILAMTFTNKAALEMKVRIIEALYGLANYDKLEGKALEDAKGVFKELQKKITLSPQDIFSRSKEVLEHILHNYEDFNVLTIDKFNLRLIRAFSRDLDLQENFQVSLEQDIILSEVIDELISKIGQKGEEEITKYALAYAKANSEDGDSWDFRRSLKEFSKVLTKEKEQEHIALLLEKDFTLETYDYILAQLKIIENEHKEKCLSLYQNFQRLGTEPSDYFQGNNGIYGFLTKINNRTLKEFAPIGKNAQAYIDQTESALKKPLEPAILNELLALLEWEDKHIGRYFILNKIRGNFYNLALLKHVSQELNAYKERENIVGIYEFNQKISNLLTEEKASYIYERLGNKFEHFLLDEFQDTSRLQWLNLVPLIDESIAHNHENLIVGDPKQAIYRFRNGLVEQFITLPRIYIPEGEVNPRLSQISDTFERSMKKDDLKENFRSRKEVVEFNNHFFKNVLDFLPEEIRSYYSDIYQKPVKEKGGLVQFHYFENDLDEEIQIAFLLKKVEEALADGYLPGDICILTRNKYSGKVYAKALTECEEKYSIVSTDSLLVSSDIDVQFCIDYLRLRKKQREKSLQIKFASSYFTAKEKDPIQAINKYWKEGKVGNFDFSSFIKNHFEKKENLFFHYENLYDLGKKFLNLIGKSELTNPYLHHFMEQLLQFDNNEGADIRMFLEKWDEKLKTDSIQMPENDQAIKIMTMHKAKGLEFPVVIIPKIEYAIQPHKNPQFIVSDENELLHLRLSKKDSSPEFLKKAHHQEYLQLILDELNIIYVAFTRASQRLYGAVKVSDKKGEHYSSTNQFVSTTLKNWKELPAINNEQIFQVGEPQKIKKEDKSPSQTLPFYAKNLNDFLWFPELALQDEEALEEEVFNEEQKKGNQLHFFLSKVNKKEAITKVKKQLIHLGQLEKEYEEEMEEMVTKVMDLLEEQDFVKNAKQILNEQSLIIDEKKVKRPDRIYISDDQLVVIDFKSGVKATSHSKQVKEYCRYLSQIEKGKKVEGYLLYTQELELEKVV